MYSIIAEILLLKVIDVPHLVGSPLELCYDPDWLMVTKATSSMFPSRPQRWVPPLVMDDDHKYVLPLSIVTVSAVTCPVRIGDIILLDPYTMLL